MNRMVVIARRGAGTCARAAARPGLPAGTSRGRGKDGARRDVFLEMDRSELDTFIAGAQAAQTELDADRRSADGAALAAP
ncbi:hypothetical protein JL721_123 [Aureococcus anophagefferens]|nr:hypothetical protein JL721_123 [Aureococcus anophagefferens]